MVPVPVDALLDLLPLLPLLPFETPVVSEAALVPVVPVARVVPVVAVTVEAVPVLVEAVPVPVLVEAVPVRELPEEVQEEEEEWEVAPLDPDPLAMDMASADGPEWAEPVTRVWGVERGACASSRPKSPSPSMVDDPAATACSRRRATARSTARPSTPSRCPTRSLYRCSKWTSWSCRVGVQVTTASSRCANTPRTS